MKFKKDEISTKNYRKVRNEASEFLKKAKEQYYLEFYKKTKRNQSYFWRLIEDIIPKKKTDHVQDEKSYGNCLNKDFVMNVKKINDAFVPDKYHPPNIEVFNKN